MICYGNNLHQKLSSQKALQPDITAMIRLPKENTSEMIDTGIGIPKYVSYFILILSYRMLATITSYERFK